MKISFKYLLGFTVCALTASAQAQYGTPYLPPRIGTNAPVYQPSHQFLQGQRILGMKAKDNQGETLGKVRDLVFNPQNGEIFAAISLERGRLALVPSQALTVTPGKGLMGKDEVAVNATKLTISSAPSIDNADWASLDNAAFVQSIYRHYNMGLPASISGVGASTLGGKMTGTATSRANQSVKSVTPTPVVPEP